MFAPSNSSSHHGAIWPLPSSSSSSYSDTHTQPKSIWFDEPPKNGITLTFHSHPVRRCLRIPHFHTRLNTHTHITCNLVPKFNLFFHRHRIITTRSACSRLKLARMLTSSGSSCSPHFCICAITYNSHGFFACLRIISVNSLLTSRDLHYITMYIAYTPYQLCCHIYTQYPPSSSDHNKMCIIRTSQHTAKTQMYINSWVSCSFLGREPKPSPNMGHDHRMLLPVFGSWSHSAVCVCVCGASTSSSPSERYKALYECNAAVTLNDKWTLIFV